MTVSLGSMVLLVFNLGQVVLEQTQGQPTRELDPRSYLVARRGRGFTGTLAGNEGKSSEVRKSQLGDVMDKSKCSGIPNFSESFYQVINGVHSLVFLLCKLIKLYCIIQAAATHETA